MNIDPIRLFVSIKFHPRELAFLNDLIGILQTKTSEAFRWVSIQNLHLTLKFIGTANRERVNDIRDSLEAIAQSQRPFSLKFGKLTILPKARSPKILLMGISGDLQTLSILQEMVERVIVRLGLPPEPNAFLPHVTLARIKGPVTPNELKQLIQVLNCQEMGKNLHFKVREIALMQSILKPSGSIYQVLRTERFKINVPANVNAR